nr:HPr kinase/phosphatase C-terminal domain-containing protein [Phaeobacter sp.]
MHPSCCMHASCVDVNGKGLLITGPSGSGKSTLALQMMALGAVLVADDKVNVARQNDMLIATAPTVLSGVIEARGVGLLEADTVSESRIVATVDLSELETERLPHQLVDKILGLQIRKLNRVDGPHFAPALLQFLKNGARDADTAV